MEAQLRSLILLDAARVRLLQLVRSLSLPDAWIAAGFVRNAVWDSLHRDRDRFLNHRAASDVDGDVDVIWFDPLRAEREVDEELEAELRARDGSVAWSVKNQARMHLRNGDEPYRSSCDAMRFWPETATAVAVRLNVDGLEIAAPFGLADLFGGILRPGPRREVFDERLRTKRWLERWPFLRVSDS